MLESEELETADDELDTAVDEELEETVTSDRRVARAVMMRQEETSSFPEDELAGLTILIST